MIYDKKFSLGNVWTQVGFYWTPAKFGRPMSNDHLFFAALYLYIYTLYLHAPYNSIIENWKKATLRNLEGSAITKTRQVVPEGLIVTTVDETELTCWCAECNAQLRALNSSSLFLASFQYYCFIFCDNIIATWNPHHYKDLIGIMLLILFFSTSLPWDTRKEYI